MPAWPLISNPVRSRSTRRARRYTIEEYYRLVEAGLLDEDARVELLDGRIVPMAPIGPEHQWAVDALIRAFLEQETGRFRTSQGRPLPIPVWSVPEPDLMLYRIGSAHRQRHVRPEDVFLVAEVAQSTRRRDLNEKAKLYRSAGARRSWHGCADEAPASVPPMNCLS